MASCPLYSEGGRGGGGGGGDKGGGGIKEGEEEGKHSKMQEEHEHMDMYVHVRMLKRDHVRMTRVSRRRKATIDTMKLTLYSYCM